MRHLTFTSLVKIMAITIVALNLFFGVTIVYLVLENRSRGREIAQVAQRADRQVAQNTQGICTLRSDLETRSQRTKEILDENPGDPVFGIPRQTLVTSYNDQLRVVQALSHIDCERFIQKSNQP